MQAYTEDSVTIYEGLEGAVDAHKLAPHAGQSFHGVAKPTVTATVESTRTVDNSSSVGSETSTVRHDEDSADTEHSEQLTLITLRPHVRGTEPAHIVNVATVAPPPIELGGLVRDKNQYFPCSIC